MRTKAKQRRGGFTLVEVLIVVVILGILAGAVLPQFSVSSDEARESALTQNLQTIRAQIHMYQYQHDGQIPGTVTGVSLEDALANRTTVDGALDAAGAYGPYLVGRLPANPFNGLRTVQEVTANPAADSDADGQSGWIYNTATGDFFANSTEVLSDGTAAWRH